MFYKIDFIENLVKFTGKHLCWSPLFDKTTGCRPASLSKRDSGTGVFLQVLQSLKQHRFCRTSANGCFWSYPLSSCYSSDLQRRTNLISVFWFLVCQMMLSQELLIQYILQENSFVHLNEPSGKCPILRKL